MSKADLRCLSDDLLVYVFGFLDVLDFCRLERTYNRQVTAAVRQAIRLSQSVRLSALYMSPSFNYYKYEGPRGKGLTAALLSYYLRNFKGSDEVESNMDSVLPRAKGNLKILEVTDMELDFKGVFSTLRVHCLVSLTFSGCYVDSASLVSFLISVGPTLKHLNLHGSSRLRDDVVLALANSCSFQLESLMLDTSGGGISQAAIQTLCESECLMYIKSLRLQSYNLRMEGHYLENLRCLEYLYIGHTTVTFAQLEDLDALFPDPLILQEMRSKQSIQTCETVW